MSGNGVKLKVDLAHGANNIQTNFIKNYFLNCALVLNIIYKSFSNSNITVKGGFDQTIQDYQDLRKCVSNNSDFRDAMKPI